MLENLWGYKALTSKRLTKKWVSVKDSPSPIIMPKINDILKFTRDNITYKEDRSDEWQTPKQTLELKTGDCEDIAILMRAMYIGATGNLSNNGVLILYDNVIRQFHAAFVVIEDGIPYFLDNLVPYPANIDKLPFDMFKPYTLYSHDRMAIYGASIK